MSQGNRNEIETDITNIASLQSADGKISKAEAQQVFRRIKDSVQIVGAVMEMPALNFDCALRSWQSKNVTTNSTLTISNYVYGEFYNLTKSGAGTLTLPVGDGPSGLTSQRVVPAGNYMIVFGHDGTKWHFNYYQESAWT